jgi:DNA polymerase
MNLTKEIIEALIDQKDIFGDELFEESKPKGKGMKTVHSQNNKNTEVLFPASGFTEESWHKTETLTELEKLICNCIKCPLGQYRNKFVFGSGNSNADVMVVGEGPGAEEDKQGLPFVGRAGQLLTDILKAIRFTRDEVYIANIVKCRPPENRTPFPAEMDECLPYLRKQIELIKPKLILCLGLTAAQGLLKKKTSLTSLRGQLFNFESGAIRTKVMVTYHPAALLRNPNLKRDCWEDVQKLRKLYDEMKIG